MKKIAQIFFLCSFLILFGHSAIPHHHEVAKELTSYSEHHHLNLIDLLKCVFSRDLGQNHLEDFFSENIKFSIQKCEATAPGQVLILAVHRTYSEPLYLPQVLLGASFYCFSSNALRAPPCYTAIV